MGKGKIRYSCEGFRSVIKDIDEDFNAVAHFAAIAARRDYGRRGTVETIRLDSWCRQCARYEAFIGAYDRETRSTTGRNIWLMIEREVI